MSNETLDPLDRLAELDWLEDRNGCSRYATEPEESIWVCSECGEPHDPDEDEPCECCDEED